MLLYFGGYVFREETRFGSLPISILLFLWVAQLLWLSVIFRHKGAHLKKAQCKSHILHETVLIYFPWAFLPKSLNNLPTHSLHSLNPLKAPKPNPPHPHPAGILPFNMQSKEWGSALWTVATILQHLTTPPTSSFSSSRYLPTAGAATSPKIAVILKHWELHLYSAHINAIHLILGKAGWHNLLSAAVVSVFVDTHFYFLCTSERSKIYYSISTQTE